MKYQIYSVEIKSARSGQLPVSGTMAGELEPIVGSPPLSRGTSVINLDAKRRFATWAGFSSEPPGGSGEGGRKRRSGGNGLKKRKKKEKSDTSRKVISQKSQRN